MYMQLNPTRMPSSKLLHQLCILTMTNKIINFVNYHEFHVSCSRGFSSCQGYLKYHVKNRCQLLKHCCITVTVQTILLLINPYKGIHSWNIHVPKCNLHSFGAQTVHNQFTQDGEFSVYSSVLVLIEKMYQIPKTVFHHILCHCNSKLELGQSQSDFKTLYSPKSDQNPISHCNINAHSITRATRISKMIT